MTLSLRELALRACIRNLDGITDVGGLQYELVRPILRKIKNPEQLRLIESNCPQLAGANDGELWRSFIKQDIKRWDTRMVAPSNPAKWSKVYLRLKRDDQADENRAVEALNASLNAQAQERDSNKATILNAVMQPDKRRRRQTGDSSPHASSSKITIQNAKSAGVFLSALAKNKIGAGPRRSMTMSTTFKSGGNVKKPAAVGTVAAAPSNMVRQYQAQQQQQQKQIRAPVLAGSRGTGTSRDEARAGEDRLRALASGSSMTRRVLMSTPVASGAKPAPAQSSKPRAEGDGVTATADVNEISPPTPPNRTGTPIIRKRPASNVFMKTKKLKR